VPGVPDRVGMVPPPLPSKHHKVVIFPNCPLPNSQKHQINTNPQSNSKKTGASRFAPYQLAHPHPHPQQMLHHAKQSHKIIASGSNHLSSPVKPRDLPRWPRIKVVILYLYTFTSTYQCSRGQYICKHLKKLASTVILLFHLIPHNLSPLISVYRGLN